MVSNRTLTGGTGENSHAVLYEMYYTTNINNPVTQNLNMYLSAYTVVGLKFTAIVRIIRMG